MVLSLGGEGFPANAHGQINVNILVRGCLPQGYLDASYYNLALRYGRKAFFSRGTSPPGFEPLSTRGGEFN